MIALPFVLNLTPDAAPGPNLMPPALYRRAEVSAKPLFNLEPGTGGVHSTDLVSAPYGYRPLAVLDPGSPTAPFATIMRQVKGAFGRAMSHLPQIFGVSRQTLYNWLRGETPSAEYQDRIYQLAGAAAAFTRLRFKPTPATLTRKLVSDKSFLELLAAGANGEETAKKLVRVVHRGADQRARLAELLAGRKANLELSDFGGPTLDEDA